MKSIPWSVSPAWRRRLVALLSGAALALVTAGCTKDTAPRSLSANADPAAEAAGQEGEQQAAQPGMAAAPGAAAVEDPGAGAAAGTDPQASPGAAKDDSYSLEVETPDPVASGAEGTVRVKVTPRNGWKMNHEFPTKLRVTAPDGITVAKAEQAKGDAERFDDAGATFAVQFTAQSAGEKSFQAKLKFAVCTEATCTPKSQELAWVVKVQ